jgi:hypothetical protein
MSRILLSLWAMGTRERAYLRGRSGVWVSAVALAVAAACSGKSDDHPPTTATGATAGTGMFPKGAGGAAGSSGGKAGRGGTGGRGGSSGSDNEGGGAGELMTDPNGPVVEVTSPEALAAPDDGDVLVEDEVTVTCEVRARAGGQPVDPSTVAIQLLDAGNAVLEEVTAAPTGEDDEYSAVVIVDKVEENGVVGFRCIAADTATPPLLGSDTVYTFVDHGPSIVLVTPVEMSVYPLATVPFEFIVTEAPVARQDSGAAVDAVSLTVDGEDVVVGGPDADGTYVVPVDLSDTDDFSAEAGPVAFTVQARTARGGVRTLSSSFTLDDEGPTITISSPEQGSVVGSRIPVVFTVTDEFSQVDPDSVVVSIGGVDTRFDGGDSWEQDGDTFTCFLDSRETGRSDFQATISVRARDEAGNDSLAATVLVYLDNYPPVLDLVPPNVRERREITDGFECSKSFDPLGPRAPEDLQTIGTFFFPRVLIWEKTNDVGQNYPHMSGTNDSTAQLYFNPTPDAPLLVDNDDDPECDDIEATIRTSSSNVQLFPVAPDGEPWWGLGDEAVAPPLDNCDLGMDETPPPERCPQESSDLARVIEHMALTEETNEHPPVVYAVGVKANTLECTGTDWEMGSQAQGEGWLCFAARIEDNAGNIGVSRPIRLCYDDPDTSEVPDCVDDTTGATAPSCMDDCTAPLAFTIPILDRY